MTSRRRILSQSLAASMTWAAGPRATWGNVVPGAPSRRVALVIGNNAYRHNALDNAVNDGRAMAALVTSAGFSVDVKLDATRQEMLRAIADLTRAAARADVGTVLFYYAGHAAQLDWRNYLLPVDANVDALGDIRKQCVDLEVLLAGLSRTKGRTSLIILDACRDDPFGARMRLPQKGMSQYDAPAGSLLAFATAPGSVAVEIAGSTNGLYTEHLVRELSVKGVRVEDALKRVRWNVRLASHDRQVPWESTSLEGDVYLFPTKRLSQAELERQFREEFETWNRIRNSTNPGDWLAYAKRFPNGRFAELAQIRIRDLQPKAAPPTPPASRAPAVRLGPKQRVPARFLGSGNPHSAGTYPFRPVWTAGDEYTFQQRDFYSGVAKRTFTLVVKRVDEARNRVEFGNGTVTDLMGGTLQEGHQRRYDPPLQVNPAELQVGRRWSSRFDQSGAVSGIGLYEFHVRGRERVTVPAGEFSAFRIEGAGSFNGRPTRLTRWVVPGINLAVRSEIRHRGSAHVLVSATQAVSNV
jgi:hypothetical protein